MQADFHIYGHIYADIPGAYMWSFKSMWYNHIYVYMYVPHICSDSITLLLSHICSTDVLYPLPYMRTHIYGVLSHDICYHIYVNTII